MLQFVLHGWPEQLAPKLKQFFHRHNELSVEDNYIMWEHRVIIPPQGRQQLLDELHVVHPGIERMKSLAQSYLWWPGVDTRIEQKVKQCYQCQIKERKLPVMPLHPWEWLGKPWSQVHFDYAGPFKGKMLKCFWLLWTVI